MICLGYLSFSGRLIASCWLYQRLCAWCVLNWWPSNPHFFAKASCPLHSDTPAEHSALSAFPASPALPSFCPVISIIKPGRCCMTSSRGPRSAMPQRMNLNEIVQEATVSCTIGRFVPQKQSPKWGQLNQNLCFSVWGRKYAKHTNSLTWDTVTS